MTIEILQSERLVNIFEINKLPNYSLQASSYSPLLSTQSKKLHDEEGCRAVVE